MKHRELFFNATTTLLQILGSAVALFFLYRFLVRAIGIDGLGVWSLILATTSIVALANQGFSAGIVKFVAQYAAREDHERVALLLQTTLLSLGVALAFIDAAIYPLARLALAFILPHDRLAVAYDILPLALASLWLNIVSLLVQAGLVGLQRIAQCNSIEMLGSLSYLLLAFALVPRHGLIGLAYAQAIQAGAFLLITWRLLRTAIPALPLFPKRWNRALFNEIAGYGMQFQVITTSQALREPVTKALIAKFGGLGMTGYYDLASRWVVTVRELIVQANQVLIPAIAYLRERDPQSIPAIYRESYRLAFFLGVPAFTALTILSPVVSRVWIGRADPTFISFVAILAVGWLVNVLANPAYVVGLGTGNLRWILAGCLATAALNAALGWIAGLDFGVTAIVAASAFSLALGYLVVVASYHLEHRVPFAVLLPAESSRVLLACGAGVGLFFILLPRLASPLFSTSRLTEIASAALLTAILVPMWLHPLRRRLFRWVVSRAPA